MLLLNLGSVKHDARVRKEASSLAGFGHRVRLVAMEQEGDNLGSTLDGFELSLFELRTRKMPSNIAGWLLKFLEYNLKAMSRMLSFKADVYHAHDLNTLLPAWAAARLTGAKLVYDSHELFTERPIETPGLWRRVERFLIRRVDAVIAANEDRAEVMLKEYGAKELPTVIMNCPASANGRQAGGPSLREALPQEVRSRKIVLYQGGLSPNRCLESLVLSAHHLDNSAVVVFIGNPSSFSENVLQRMVREQGLERRVFFAAAVDSRQLVDYIASGDIGVVIYKNSCRNNYLCAPNKLFDYCTAGLPSIGCDFPPVRRIADEYGTTRLFDPENPESIAEAANVFIRDEEALASAKAATAAVASEFTWEREEKKLKELYDKLAGSGVDKKLIRRLE